MKHTIHEKLFRETSGNELGLKPRRIFNFSRPYSIVYQARSNITQPGIMKLVSLSTCQPISVYDIGCAAVFIALAPRIALQRRRRTHKLPRCYSQPLSVYIKIAARSSIEHQPDNWPSWLSRRLTGLAPPCSFVDSELGRRLHTEQGNVGTRAHQSPVWKELTRVIIVSISTSRLQNPVLSSPCRTKVFSHSFIDPTHKRPYPIA